VLKEAPTEVTIVQRKTTGKVVAAQVGLNILMLALGGGVGGFTFSKDDLKGERIEDVEDRTNLKNPVPTAFVQSLQEAIKNRMDDNNMGQNQTFRYSIVVGGGSANLIYESLIGSEEPRYQLVLKLNVYKRAKRGWFKSVPPVDCSDKSAPAQPLAYWADSSYSNVRQELDRMLSACQSKVLDNLPNLLGIAATAEQKKNTQ
jgi:hypothetical protein